MSSQAERVCEPLPSGVLQLLDYAKLQSRPAAMYGEAPTASRQIMSGSTPLFLFMKRHCSIEKGAVKELTEDRMQVHTHLLLNGGSLEVPEERVFTQSDVEKLVGIRPLHGRDMFLVLVAHHLQRYEAPLYIVETKDRVFPFFADLDIVQRGLISNLTAYQISRCVQTVVQTAYRQPPTPMTPSIRAGIESQIEPTDMSHRSLTSEQIERDRAERQASVERERRDPFLTLVLCS
jgi:hypothetical protein